ncbi:Metallo-dependent phosphatase [Auriculariales sp. MPI-PUGE-AT-0066]|nr:Metallo-dependent phosphatase [Auriculariales sp. MPI-PUGE-AT-0066]
MLSAVLLVLPLLGCRFAGAVPNGQQSRSNLPKSSGGIAMPDFSQYIDMRTLTREDLDVDARRQVLFVGDITGCSIHSSQSLYRYFGRMLSVVCRQLLAKARYDPRRDTLIHTGDIITRGVDSLGVLDWLSSHNILGVRGNNDQKVLEWRGWIEWVSSHRGGGNERWMRFPIPSRWFFNGEVFHVAKIMTAKHYKYLLYLPVTLHLAPLHTLVVHAGLLPMDPTREPTSKSQPLAHLPKVHHPKPPTHLLRLAQEAAIVAEVPQNTEPWARLNMRSILEDGTVSRRSKAGEPWPVMWNAVMDMCDGFDSFTDMGNRQNGQLILNQKPKIKLPCHPVTVVYGHSAAHGLDINRWSKGIDTGCGYGRELTALILPSEHKHFLDEGLHAEDVEETPFSDNRVARVLRVRCVDDSFAPSYNGTQ